MNFWLNANNLFEINLEIQISRSRMARILKFGP